MLPLKPLAEVIDKRRSEIGMTVRALSKKTGIGEGALYGSLGGKRKFTGSELLAVSAALDLKFDDYIEKKAV